MTPTPDLEALCARLQGLMERHKEAQYAPPSDAFRLVTLFMKETSELIPTLLAALRGAGERVCKVCTATVSAYPEGMCCHCQEMPWPLSTPTGAEIAQAECDCAARNYGDDRGAHQLQCATFAPLSAPPADESGPPISLLSDEEKLDRITDAVIQGWLSMSDEEIMQGVTPEDLASVKTNIADAIAKVAASRSAPPADAREGVAKIINPAAWARRAEFQAIINGTALNMPDDPEKLAMYVRSATRRVDTVVAASLETADAILALIPSRAEVEPKLFDAVGSIVSMLADGKDVYPDAATALEAITETINELYGCMEGGVFGPIGGRAGEEGKTPWDIATINAAKHATAGMSPEVVRRPLGSARNFERRVAALAKDNGK